MDKPVNVYTWSGQRKSLYPNAFHQFHEFKANILINNLNFIFILLIYFYFIIKPKHF